MILETPHDFILKKASGNNLIEIKKLIEICQGGPEVGTLTINNLEIPRKQFGGPYLIHGDSVYVPFFVRRMCLSGFRLAKVNINSLEVTYFGRTTDIICIDRIEGNRLYYFENSERSGGGKYIDIRVALT